MKGGISKLILDFFLQYARDVGILPLHGTQSTATQSNSSQFSDTIFHEGEVEFSASGVKLKTPALCMKPFQLSSTILVRSFQAVTGLCIDADLSTFKIGSSSPLLAILSLQAPCANPMTPQFTLSASSSNLPGPMPSLSLTAPALHISLPCPLQCPSSCPSCPQAELTSLHFVQNSSSRTLTVQSFSLSSGSFTLQGQGLGVGVAKSGNSRVTLAKAVGKVSAVSLAAAIIDTAWISNLFSTSGTSGAASDTPHTRIDSFEFEFTVSSLSASLQISDLAVSSTAISFSSLRLCHPSCTHPSLSLPATTIPLSSLSGTNTVSIPSLNPTVHIPNSARLHTLVELASWFSSVWQVLTTLLNNVLFQSNTVPGRTNTGCTSAAPVAPAKMANPESAVRSARYTPASSVSVALLTLNVNSPLEELSVTTDSLVFELFGESSAAGLRAKEVRLKGRICGFGLEARLFSGCAVEVCRHSLTHAWVVKSVMVNMGYVLLLLDGVNSAASETSERIGEPFGSPVFEMFSISQLQSNKEGSRCQIAVTESGIPVSRLFDIPTISLEDTQLEEDSAKTEKLLSDWERDFGLLPGSFSGWMHAQIEIKNLFISVLEAVPRSPSPSTTFILSVADLVFLNAKPPTGQISLSEGFPLDINSDSVPISHEHYIAWAKLGKSEGDDSMHSMRSGQYYLNLFANLELHHLLSLKRVLLLLQNNLPGMQDARKMPPPSAQGETPMSETISDCSLLMLDLSNSLPVLRPSSNNPSLDSASTPLKKTSALLCTSPLVSLEEFRHLQHLLQSKRDDGKAIQEAAHRLLGSVGSVLKQQEQDENWKKSMPEVALWEQFSAGFGDNGLVLGSAEVTLYRGQPGSWASQTWAIVYDLKNNLEADYALAQISSSRVKFERTEVRVVIIFPDVLLHIDAGEFECLSEYLLAPAVKQFGSLATCLSKLISGHSFPKRLIAEQQGERTISDSLVSTLWNSELQATASDFQRFCSAIGLISDTVQLFPRGHIFRAAAGIQIVNKLDWGLLLDGKYFIPAHSATNIAFCSAKLRVRVIDCTAKNSKDVSNTETVVSLFPETTSRHQNSGFLVSMGLGSMFSASTSTTLPWSANVTVGGPEGSWTLLETLQICTKPSVPYRCSQTGLLTSKISLAEQMSLPCIFTCTKTKLSNHPGLSSIEITFGYLLLLENHTQEHFSGGKFPYSTRVGFGWADNPTDLFPRSAWLPQPGSLDRNWQEEQVLSEAEEFFPKQKIPLTIPAYLSVGFFPQTSVAFFREQLLPRLVPLLHLVIHSKCSGYSAPKHLRKTSLTLESMYTAPLSNLLNRSQAVPDLCPDETVDSATEAPVLKGGVSDSAVKSERTRLLAKCTLVNCGANSPIICLVTSGWYPSARQAGGLIPRTQPNNTWLYLPQCRKIVAVSSEYTQTVKENASLEVKDLGFVALEDPKVTISFGLTAMGTYRVAGLFSGNFTIKARYSNCSTTEQHLYLDISTLRMFKDSVSKLPSAEATKINSQNPQDCGPIFSVLNAKVDASWFIVEPLGLRVFNYFQLYGAKVFTSPARLSELLQKWSSLKGEVGRRTDLKGLVRLEPICDRLRKWIYHNEVTPEVTRRRTILATKCEAIFRKTYMKLCLISEISLVLSDGQQMKPPAKLKSYKLTDHECPDLTSTLMGILAQQLLPSLLASSPLTTLRTAFSFWTSSSAQELNQQFSRSTSIPLLSERSLISNALPPQLLDPELLQDPLRIPGPEALLARFVGTSTVPFSLKPPAAPVPGNLDDSSSQDSDQSSLSSVSTQPDSLQLLITQHRLLLSSASSPDTQTLSFPLKIGAYRHVSLSDVWRVTFRPSVPEHAESSTDRIPSLSLVLTKAELDSLKEFFAGQSVAHPSCPAPFSN